MKKYPVSNETNGCTIITLCKKAAHPTLVWFVPGQHFLQLPSHHPATKNTVLHKPLSIVRRIFVVVR